MGLLTNPNAPRKELKRKDLALRGVVALVVAMLLLGFTYLKATGAFGDAPEVKTSLTNVGGSLASGSDVKMKGALIGKVKSIDPDDGRVNVVLSMDKESIDSVPANVQARVLPATVFGTSFIDLTVPDGKQPQGTLEADDTISEDLSKPTIELQQALDDVDALVKALGPAELASAIGSAAAMLDGRGKQIGRSLDLANSYLTRLNATWPLFREDLGLLVENLDIVRTYAPDLLAAVDDSLVAARTIFERRAQLTSVLAGGLNLVKDADRFLTRQRARFVRSIRLAAIVTDAVYDNRHAGLYQSFLANIRASDNITREATAYDVGGGRGVIHVVLGPTAYYTAADCPRYQGSYGCGNTGGAGR